MTRVRQGDRIKGKYCIRCMVTGFQMSIPQDWSKDNPWTLLNGSSADLRPEPDRPMLQIETIEDVEPLDTQIGVFPKKTVPDALYDALFGQPDPTAAEVEAAGGDDAAALPMQTYAILEAAKLANLPELLERSGVEHRCLFKGAAYDELKDVAPWIVRMEEGNAFTRNLFTRSNAAWHLWDDELGIYVRSREGLDSIWRYFRKFTKVQDEDGKWFYFRFWEPAFIEFSLDILKDLDSGFGSRLDHPVTLLSFRTKLA